MNRKNSRFVHVIAPNQGPVSGQHVEIYQRTPTGTMLPCPGEAHKTLADHCAECSPRWGQVAELAPVDLAEAKAKSLAVSVSDLTNEQITQAKKDGAKLLWCQKVHRTSGLFCSSFMVLVQNSGAP